MRVIYRYYISKELVHSADNQSDGWRVAAGELEQAIAKVIAEFLGDDIVLASELQVEGESPDVIERVFCNSKNLAAEVMGKGGDASLSSLLQRVTLAKHTLKIELSRVALTQRIFECGDQSDDPICLEAPIAFRRRGVEGKLVLGSNPMCAPDAKLTALVARSHRWLEQLTMGAATSVKELAAEANIDPGDVSRFLPLAFLAPDIVEAILAGRQPTELTVEVMRRACPIPHEWSAQRRLLGFTR